MFSGRGRWWSGGGFRALLGTSSFRHTITVAFVFLLVSLASVIWSRYLLEGILRTHVTQMILRDVTAQIQATRLVSATLLSQSLEQGRMLDRNPERRSVVADARDSVTFGSAELFRRLEVSSRPCGSAPCEPSALHVAMPGAEILGLRIPLADGGTYFSGYDIRPMVEQLRIIPLVAGSGLFAVLLSSLFISLYFSMSNLRRVDGISQTLERFASGQPGVRVPLGLHQDEFTRLGKEINQSLDRFNRLVEEIKSSSSHIAHELRTPLTSLQNRLITISENSDGTTRAELALAVQEIDEIQDLFRTILRLSEIEAWSCLRKFQDIQAGTLLADIADYYLPLAEQQGCTLGFAAEQNCLLFGDRDLLFQALANLVDNALKYAPAASAVRLRAWSEGGWTFLAVSDQGSGIAPDMRDLAVQRFCRLANSYGKPGNGLGLPLVKAIAECHRGELILGSSEPGLMATIKIKTGYGRIKQH